jgi:hypothetical protein
MSMVTVTTFLTETTRNPTGNHGSKIDGIEELKEEITTI